MEAAWPELSSGVQLVLSGSLLPQWRWLRIRTLVHQCCCTTERTVPHQLYSSLRDLFSAHSQSVARRLSQSPGGVDLLQLYSHEWTQFQEALRTIHDLFSPLNRTWAHSHSRHGVSPLPGVFDSTTLGLVTWRQKLVDPLEHAFLHAMLDLLDAWRQGEGGGAPARRLLRESVGGWFALGRASQLPATPPPVKPFPPRRHAPRGDRIELGGDDGTSSESDGEGGAAGKPPRAGGRNSLYERLEASLVERSGRFHAARGEAALAACARAEEGQRGVLSYLDWVGEALQLETECAEIFPEARTREAMRAALLEALLHAHRAQIEAHIKPLLLADRETLLRKLYLQLHRLDALPLLEVALHRYILSIADDALDTFRRATPRASLPATDEAASLRVASFVSAALSVVDKFRATVRDAFAAHRGCEAVLHRACRSFLNAPADNTAEQLALYCSAQLLPPAHASIVAGQRSEREEKLTRALQLLEFLDDQDHFVAAYRKLLGDRLLEGTSFSLALESFALSRISALVALERTSTLRRMLMDAKASAHIHRSAASHGGERSCGPSAHSAPEVRVLVLTAGAWPLITPSIRAPYPLTELHETFERRYLSSHESRRLCWAPHCSEGELMTTYLPKKYTLQLSGLQLCLLLCFNAVPSRTCAQLREALLPDEEQAKPLLSALGRLVAAGLLKMDSGVDASSRKPPVELLAAEERGEPSSCSSEEAAVEFWCGEDFAFSLDAAWTHEDDVVCLNATARIPWPRRDLKSETTPQRAKRNVAEDEKVLIDAAVVRVLKAQGKLAYADLLSEIKVVLAPRVRPEVAQVQASLGRLIEIEYIARDEHAHDIFVYIP